MAEVITIAIPGQQGPMGSLTIGAITEGPSAAASITGEPPNQVLNLTIPTAAGVTDHGELDGLEDDDHPQYHNDARGDARYSLTAHTHLSADITDATSSGTANTIAKRDASGYSSFARVLISDAPSSASHATRKDYVDALGAEASTASTVVRRDASSWIRSSRTIIETTPPTNANEATRKDYVDTQVATKADTTHTHTSAQISDATDVSSASTVVRRTAGGSAGFANVDVANTPSAAQHATRKDYVDTQVATKISSFTDPNADRIVFWDDSASAYAALSPTAPLTISGTAISISAASDTASGIVELATNAETQTGSDAARAVTPAGLQSKTASETAIGLVELATTAETTTGTDTTRAVTAAGVKAVVDTKAALSHTHVATTDLTATGTKDSTTFLRGDNTWAVPAGGGGGWTAVDASETVKGIAEIATSAETTTGTDDLRIVTPLKLKGIADTKANTSITISAGTGLTGGGDLTTNRTLTVAYGSASGTAVQGNDARVTADQAAGTASIRTIGTGALQAAAGNHTHLATAISDSTATGRSVLTATDAAAARTAIGAGTSSLAIGTTGSTAKAGDYQPTAANISDSTTVGRAVLTAVDAAAGRTAIGAGTSNLAIGTTGTTAKAGDYQPTAANISDSTATGRSVLTAADAAAARTAIGAGTYTAAASSETISGIVELATAAETTTGTDNTRAVHPAGLKVELDKKALTTTTVSAGTGLTGGGDLSANRTLTVSYGSSSGTAVQGNDTRVTADQAAGTASIRTLGTGATQAAAGNHVHTSKDVTNPSVALTDGATIAVDASLGRLFRVTIAGNRTILAPSNAVDGMRVMFEVTASGADRTLTLTTGSAGAFAYGTDFTSIPTIVSGTTAFIGAIYSSRSSRWHVLAVGVGHA